MTTQGKLQTRMQMSLYKDFLKAVERSSLQKQAVGSHNATKTLRIQHALSSSSPIHSLDRSAKRRKIAG